MIIRKINILIIIFLLLTVKSFSQNEEKKWALGTDVGFLVYNKNVSPSVGYRFLPTSLRISAAKYMFKDIIFAGSITSAIDDIKEYTSFDGEIRYDFGTSRKEIFNLFSIYTFIGGSYITEPLSVTLNLGVGGTLWISDHFGLSGRLVFKINEEEFENTKTHFRLSGGLVYRFSMGGEKNDSKNQGSSKGSRQRLWD